MDRVKLLTGIYAIVLMIALAYLSWCVNNASSDLEASIYLAITIIMSPWLILLILRLIDKF